MDEERFETRRGRLLGFRIVTVLLFLVLVRQLFALQVLDGEAFRQQAEENQLRVVWTAPDRGVIYDHTGAQLVRNVPSLTVAIVRGDLPRAPEPVYQHLEQLLGVPAAEIRQTIDTKGKLFDIWTPIPIKRSVDLAVESYIEERPRQFPGVQVIVEGVREYTDGPAFAHVLGYVGPMGDEQYDELTGAQPRSRYTPADRIGQAGIESMFETELRGRPAQIEEEVDSTGRVRNVRTPFRDPGEEGHSVILTLDAKLQEQVAQILSEHIDRYGTASAIVMDVRTGAIRAMVDLPSYDNNMFSRPIDDEELDALLNDPRRPLLNKSVGGAYPPGSVFKIVTALAALHEGVVFPTTIVPCRGSIFVPSDVARGQGERLNDWTLDGHGDQDLVSALANSCDVFFYQVAGGEPFGKWDGLGNEKLAYWARQFGLGAVTGIGLPGEIAGLVPDANWKKRALPGEPWLKGNTFTYGIGQSYLEVSPIQMLNAMVAVANGGTLLRPQIIQEVRDANGRTLAAFQPQVIRQIPIDQRYFDIVRRGVEAGMEPIGETENGAKYVGTSYDSAVPEAKFAGKTGTAETGFGKQTHGWFAGYAPADNPEVAVLVFVENGSGSYNAAVRAEKIIRAYFGLPETAHNDTFK